MRITGRKKEILVTAGGKNVAPAVLEDRLRAHLLVDQCIVVGDGQAVHRARWSRSTPRPSRGGPSSTASRRTVADLVDDPDLRAEIEAAVDEANKAVSKAEAIRKFAILPDAVDRGGRAAHAEPQAEAQRRDARESTRTSRRSTAAETGATLTLGWPLGHVSWSFRAMRWHIRNARSRFASRFLR